MVVSTRITAYSGQDDCALTACIWESDDDDADDDAADDDGVSVLCAVGTGFKPNFPTEFDWEGPRTTHIGA